MQMQTATKSLPSNATNTANAIKKPKGFGKRHTQGMLCFFGYAAFFLIKTNMVVGVMAMIDNTHNPDYPAYNWNEAIRSTIISSVFFGYIISPMIAGMALKYTGPLYPAGISLIIMGIFSCLTVVFAELGWEYVVMSRLIQGFVAGFCFPCFHTILSKWSHPFERGILASFATSGAGVGMFTIISLSGVIASSPLGWPAIFYLSGGFGIISGIVLLLFCYPTPAAHPTISEAERNFIESMPGNDSEKKSVPYRAILTSKPFWGLLITQLGESWAYPTILSSIPAYLYGILKFDIVSNGILSSLPYVMNFVYAFLQLNLSDFLIRNNYISLTRARKLFNTTGQWGPAVCFTLLIVLPVSRPITITILTISLGLNAGIFSGYLVNHIDISPNFAGNIMGMCQTLANVFAFLAPFLMGFIVSDITDKSMWNLEFLTVVVFFFFPSLFFIIFGSGEVQEWN